MKLYARLLAMRPYARLLAISLCTRLLTKPSMKKIVGFFYYYLLLFLNKSNKIPHTKAAYKTGSAA